MRRPALRVSPERLTLIGLLLATFALLADKPDQPIVENYVGRQIPTAMVARNLDRGSGFLHPELDTGPFPNLFLVEPPIFGLCAAALHRQSGLALEPSGRLVSALATTLAAWGLFGLTRRREGPTVALLAVGAFAIFPLTIRYGRAFQPDAFMLGTVVAGLRCWDEHEAGRDVRWLAPGWILLAAGLAQKVTSAAILFPLIFAVLRPIRRWKVALVLSALLPALLWYAHVALVLSRGEGSSASADNAAIWLRILLPGALLRPATYLTVGRFLVVRAFTPLGFALAIYGWIRHSDVDRLWPVWALSTAATLVILAGKLHHEYYLLPLAPLAAVGLALALVDLSGRGFRGRCVALAAWVGFGLVSALLAASTWRTPSEWGRLVEAAEGVNRLTPRGEMLVAPEALLYQADRRGYRLENTRESATRAAREWGVAMEGPIEPFELIPFYHQRGAVFLADVQPGPNDPGRRGLHAAVRSRLGYPIVADRPGPLLLVRLAEPKSPRRRLEQPESAR
jgi:hypothetical protein